MEYVSCYSLEHALVFDRTNDIKPCCNSMSKFNNNIFYQKNYSGGFFDTDKYIEIRNKYIEMMMQGNIPEQCRGCFCLEKKNWDDEKFVETVCIANESKCSCDCFYCDFAEDKEYFNRRRSYNIMPVLKNLKEKNLLKNTCFTLAGGECTEYPDEYLKEIIDFALDSGGYLDIFSAGIKYSRHIEKAMSLGRANICVSIDAGTKETYERIKRVKAFDIVWENMRRYQAAALQQNNWGRVRLKYIIIPGINDNIEELGAFIEKARQAHCFNIMLNVEYKWWRENCNKEIPSHLWKLLDFMEECRKDFDIEYFENSVYLWKKRMAQDKNYKGINPVQTAV